MLVLLITMLNVLLAGPSLAEGTFFAILIGWLFLKGIDLAEGH
jgi:hypothetical protein